MFDLNVVAGQSLVSRRDNRQGNSVMKSKINNVVHALSIVSGMTLIVWSMTTTAQQSTSAPCSPQISGITSSSGEAVLTLLSQDNCVEPVAEELPSLSVTEPTGQLADVIEAADRWIALKPYWISNSETDIVTAVDGYNRKPALEGLTDLYKATRNADYVNLAIAMAHEYIDSGTDVTGDGYNDWYSSNRGGYNDGHYEWRAAAGIAYLLSELYDLEDSVNFAGEIDKFTQYLEVSVWEKWEPGSPVSHLDHIGTTATYFIGRLGLTAIALHKITGDDKYLQWLNSSGGDLIRSLKNQYNSDLDTYNLTGRTNGDDVAASPTPGTVDIGHAHDAFSFLSFAKTEGYDLGGEYDDVVLSRVMNTLTKVLFVNDRFAANVDGSGGVGVPDSDSNGGVARFAAYDSDMLERYVQYATLESTYASGVISYEARVHTLGGLAFALVSRDQQ